MVQRTFSVRWQGQTLYGELLTYPHPRNPAIQLYDADGLPYARVSVNPDTRLPDGMIAIKDYGENAGVLAALVAAGIIEPTGETIPLGFDVAHLCRLRL